MDTTNRRLKQEINIIQLAEVSKKKSAIMSLLVIEISRKRQKMSAFYLNYYLQLVVES